MPIAVRAVRSCLNPRAASQPTNHTVGQKGNINNTNNNNERLSLTFLHSLEGVVGLDQLDGVGDLLTLQHVIAEAEV